MSVLKRKRTRFRYNFAAAGDIVRSRHALSVGDEIVLSAKIKNTGSKLGTAYVRMLIANSMHRDKMFFDSNKDLPFQTRETLRLVDMRVGETRQVACRWKVPARIAPMHFDIRMEIWNPHYLYGGPRPHRFFDTGWVGGFGVVSTQGLREPRRVFISYSWDGKEHELWVKRLTAELRRHNIESILDKYDLLPGEETTAFMERGIARSGCVVLICSENYTKKADSRRRGVGYETIILSEEFRRAQKKRTRFIPVVRDNSLAAKLPRYLGSTVYVEMSGKNWRGEPMLKLVRAIERGMGT